MYIVHAYTVMLYTYMYKYMYLCNGNQKVTCMFIHRRECLKEDVPIGSLRIKVSVTHISTFA